MRDEKWNKEIGDRLALTREALGYDSQAGFVDAFRDVFPLSTQRWNHYERGRERITPPVALALCLKFDLTLDWIYRGKQSMLPIDLVERIRQAQKKRRAAPERPERQEVTS